MKSNRIRLPKSISPIRLTIELLNQIEFWIGFFRQINMHLLGMGRVWSGLVH